MNRLRRSVLHRLLAGFALVGMVLWAGAPLAAAQPQVAAAQAAKTHATGPVEMAVAEALEVASRSADPSGAFVAALAGALQDHPDAEAILDLVSDEEGLARLLDALVGQLLRAAALQTPLLMAAATAQTNTAASSGSGLQAPGGSPAHRPASVAAPSTGQAPAPSIWQLSAAQPLGP